MLKDTCRVQYVTTCSLPIFTKAIPIQRNGLTEVSSWCSSNLYGSSCGSYHHSLWCASHHRKGICRLLWGSLYQEHGNLQQWHLCCWGFCKPLPAFPTGLIAQRLWGVVWTSKVFPRCRSKHLVVPRWMEDINEWVGENSPPMTWAKIWLYLVKSGQNWRRKTQGVCLKRWFKPEPWGLPVVYGKWDKCKSSAPGVIAIN